MKNVFLIVGLIAALYSCGGDDPVEAPAPAPAPAAAPEDPKEEPDPADAIADSLLLAQLAVLTEGLGSTDSLRLQLDSLSISNDSLIKLIAVIKDTMETNFPIIHPKPIIDSTDYNKPPDGNPKRHSYKLFSGFIPDKGKAQKSFPKELIGSYVNSNNSSSKLKITSTDLTYTKDSDTAMFIIASNRIYTISSDYHILNYENDKGWTVVLLEMNGTNLSFKTIKSSAKLTEAPTKKELKKYLEGNTGSVKTVFIKVG